jgi:hypothetical protein
LNFEKYTREIIELIITAGFCGQQVKDSEKERVAVTKCLQEQCTEWQRQLIVNVIDFEKAFDSIHIDSL